MCAGLTVPGFGALNEFHFQIEMTEIRDANTGVCERIVQRLDFVRIV